MVRHGSQTEKVDRHALMQPNTAPIGIPVGMAEMIDGITYLADFTADGLAKATRGDAKVFEEFGFQSGKTARAFVYAKRLNSSGKRVIIADGLLVEGIGGVRVYAR